MLSNHNNKEELEQPSYVKEVMRNYPNDAGKILYPLIKQDAILHSEFDDSLRDIIFNHILTLPSREKESALKEIKEGMQPMKDLFWDNKDILFIHRTPKLPTKLLARIDEELAAIKFSVSSPRLFSSTSVKQQDVHRLIPPNTSENDDKESIGNRKEQTS